LRDRAIFFFLSQFVGDDYLHSVISWRELETEANEAASGQMKKVGLAVEIQRRGGVRIEMLAIAKEPNLLEYLRWIAWRVLGVQYLCRLSMTSGWELMGMFSEKRIRLLRPGNSFSPWTT